MNAGTKKAKYDRIKEKKVSTSIEELSRGVPKEVGSYLDYVRKLKFEDKPDYRLCRNFFADAFERLGFDHDYYYDWILKKHNLAKSGSMLPSSSVRGPLNRPKAERGIENKPPVAKLGKKMEDTSAHFFEKKDLTT